MEDKSMDISVHEFVGLLRDGAGAELASEMVGGDPAAGAALAEVIEQALRPQEDEA